MVMIHGLIYNPEDGADYNCKMWMENKDIINLRGYIGLSLLGSTEKLTRIKS